MSFTKGFVEHGIQIVRETEKQVQARCPKCGGDKFFFNPNTGLWDCKPCIISGNFEGFLHLIAPIHRQALVGPIQLQLATNRGLKPQTLRSWGVGYIPSLRVFTIPMNGNPKRNTGDIHRYTLGKKAFGTSNGKHQLFAPGILYGSQRVWICEGEWDAMALWEAFQALGIKEDVYASPGAGTFPKNLAGMFDGKDVVLLFDHDEPGKKGAKRTGQLLSGAKSVKYLHWTPDVAIKDGFDIRDLYTERKKDLKSFFEYIKANLKTNAPGASKDSDEDERKGSGKGLHHEEVVKRYREWLHINNTDPLYVLYGAAFANRIDIDPLWLFIIGAPGAMKTELLMSLSEAFKMTSTTSLTPHSLVSGMSTAGGDPSLVPKLNGKTLIVKDFTTILNMQQSARDEIFGILRDCYDGKTEKHFGNGVVRRYSSRFGILAGVTPAIEGIAAQSSVLGERFIKYRIKQTGRINVGREPIERALKNMTQETSMRKNLQEIANETLSRDITREDIPKIDSMIVQQLLQMAQFVAALRGSVNRDKYTQKVLHKPVQEIGTRLAKQLGALCLGIAIFRQEKRITDETLRIVKKVACGTAPDKVEELIKQIYVHESLEKKSDGFLVSQIAEWSRLPNGTVSDELQDMEMLGLVRKTVGLQRTYKVSSSVKALITKLNLYRDEIDFVKKSREL